MANKYMMLFKFVKDHHHCREQQHLKSNPMMNIDSEIRYIVHHLFSSCFSLYLWITMVSIVHKLNYLKSFNRHTV